MKASILDFTLLLSICQSALSFSTPVSHSAIQTVLFAEESERSPKRRSVLGNLRRAVVGTATLAAFRSKPLPVNAAEEILSSPGRIVQLEIANLGGEAGNTGIVKIKLQPEWAPRGVKRFEVRLHLIRRSITSVVACLLTSSLTGIFRN